MTAKARLSLISIMLLGAAVHGQEPNGVPAGYAMETVVYGDSDGEELIYEVFRPAQPNGAAVVQIMSGGCLPLTVPASDFLLGEGFTSIFVQHGNYGNPEIGPDILACADALADVRRAIRHIRLNAAEYGVDPDRLGVTGFSSGGILALLVGYTSDSGNASSEDAVERTGNRVAAVVAGAATGDVSDMVERRANNGPEGFEPDQIAAFTELLSANLYIDPDDPPTLLVHGSADELMPIGGSEEIREVLLANGVETDLKVIPDAGHDGEAIMATRDSGLDWFRRYLLEE